MSEKDNPKKPVKPTTKRVSKLAVPLDDESFDEDGNLIGNATERQADKDAEGEWP